jgi:hypothetical protein
MKAILMSLGLSTVLLTACSTMPREVRPVSREFEALRVSRIILRASAADRAIGTTVIRDAPFVSVFGIPSGGARGYHSSDPNWRETPASERGLDFVSRRFGSTLVISTKNEISYLHHRYTLEQIDVILPSPCVKLVREVRRLTGNPAPDLSPP